MTDETASARIEGFYRMLWPLEDEGDDRLARLDEDLGGKRLDQQLFKDLMAQGLDANMTLLDLGCGKGTYTLKFRQIFGCRVIGVDPLAHNLAQASAQVGAEDEKVELQIGRLESMPLLAAGSVDWIWCYDSFNHVQDMTRAFEECLRVLRPGGRMLLCSAIAHGSVTHLEPACRQLGLSLLSLKRPAVEEAWQAAGFRPVLSQSTADSDSRYFEAFHGHEARDYLRLAHLMRARRRFELILGAEACDYLQAYYFWNVMLMIRQIEYVVWILQKPADSP